MKITDYMIVRSSTTGDLAKTVKLLIGDGWEPQGGVAVIGYESDRDWWLMQAMIRKGEYPE